MTAHLPLDTHAYVWARAAPARLTAAERRLLASAGRVRVSAASLWEVANLGALGRIDDVDELLSLGSQYELLPVEPAHCRELLALPPGSDPARTGAPTPFPHSPRADAHPRRSSLHRRHGAVLIFQ